VRGVAWWVGVGEEGHSLAAPSGGAWAGTSWKLVAGGGARLKAGSGRRCRADPEEERFLIGARQ